MRLGQVESIVLAQRDRDDLESDMRHRRPVGRKGRREQRDAVSRVAGHVEELADDQIGRADHDLMLVDRAIGDACISIRQRRAQLQKSCHWGIAELLGLDGGHCRPNNLLRRSNPGIAELKMADSMTLALERLGAVHDFKHFLADQPLTAV